MLRNHKGKWVSNLIYDHVYEIISGNFIQIISTFQDYCDFLFLKFIECVQKAQQSQRSFEQNSELKII